MNFDCEASFIFHDSLYLFSKDRSSPYTGFSKLYRLPKNAGTYTAKLLDSFCFGNSNVNTNSITSADILPDGSKMVLISHEEMWVFENFFQQKYFTGNYQHYLLSTTNAYKEGVVFVNQNELYLTDEKHSSKEGNLYRVELPQNSSMAETIDAASDWSVYPNPCGQSLVVSHQSLVNTIEVINLVGQKMKTNVIDTSSYDLRLDTYDYPNGIYFLKISTPNGNVQVKKFIKN
jgi:hypothetical protein